MLLSDMLVDYTIIEKLGDQKVRKFGTVYLVQHNLNKQYGVLKTLAKTESLSRTTAFRNEAKITFEHERLPSTLLFSETDSDYILIKKWFVGQPLPEFWKTVRKKDRWDSLLKICASFESIFNELKTHKIVHCDIKPSNIIVTHENDSISIALIDFGMAINTSETNERNTLFSLGFAAPELILNRYDLVDQRTDFYAFGIVLFQLLCDEMPFAHKHPGLMTQLCITYPLPNHHNLSKSQFHLLAKMCYKFAFKSSPNRLSDELLVENLKKGLENRFANYNDFLNALKKIVPKKRFLFF
jgi:eukaryotic-like serine/threonine-protein kinase